MKIIFLDIDGVMNHQLYYREKSQHERHNSGDIYDIDPVSVGFLNTLIDQTGAKVVISSTWRHSGIEYCRTALLAKGFQGEIIDITPNLRHEGCLRGNEIYHWININSEMLCGTPNGSDFKEYVILDDDTDMLYWQGNNFIQIDPYAGLTPNHCYRAKFILCPTMTFSDSFNTKVG